MYSLVDVCIFLVFVLLVLYWWRSRELHAQALKCARKYCKERDIQLLDETLMFDKFARSKAGNGRKYLSRIYIFDFCRDGTDRHRGEIILRGNAVLRVMLEGDALEITQY